MVEKQYFIGAYEKAFPEECSLEEMLRLASEVGYDFFEMSIDRTDARISRLYDECFMEELETILRNSPIKIGSICLSALGTYTLGNLNEVNRSKAVDIFKHAILFAERFGVRVIQIPGCDVPKFDNRTSETNAIFFENISVLIDIAAKYGITIAIENMENDYMDTVEKTMKLVSHVNSPYLQIYPDAGNITSAALLYGNDVLDDMSLGRGHYVAFHLKETRPNKYGGLFYGEGHVDFQRCTSIAWDLGTRRFVMEYWYTGNTEWRNDLAKAKQLCTEWIEKSIKD